MKIKLLNHHCTVIREEGDPRMKTESQLLYHVKLRLVDMGHDVIKKRIQKDGHMFGYEAMQYIRTRSPKSPRPHICIYNGNYCFYDAHEPYNQKGVVDLQVEWDIFYVQEEDDTALWNQRLEEYQRGEIDLSLIIAYWFEYNNRYGKRRRYIPLKFSTVACAAIELARQDKAEEMINLRDHGIGEPWIEKVTAEDVVQWMGIEKILEMSPKEDKWSKT